MCVKQKKKTKMKNLLLILTLCTASLTCLSQDYLTEDVLYYDGNKLVQRKTGIKVIVKEVVVSSKKQAVNKYLVDKYTVNSDNKYVLESEFFTLGLNKLKTDGKFISFYENGQVASEGPTENGEIAPGIWTYYYRNGKKKFEEKIIHPSPVNDNTKQSILNYWNKKGKQLVTNGNGFVSIVNERGITEKGTYKDTYKSGIWTGYKDGKKLYEENYSHGSLITGKSWSVDDKVYKYKKIKESAYYKKKHNSEIKKFVYHKLSTNLPHIEGAVKIIFSISKEGTVKDIDVIKHLDNSHDEAVKKILLDMVWSPAKYRGQTQKSKYVLDLHFHN